jgi:transposase
MPFADTEAMQAHLAEISDAVAPDAHAVLVLDQAGWHVSGRLAVPDNITLLPLPPRSPELNPVENLWQFMRQNWLSNRIFDSYDDIVAHCCEAWNKLTDQPCASCPSASGNGTRVLISERWYKLIVLSPALLLPCPRPHLLLLRWWRDHLRAPY